MNKFNANSNATKKANLALVYVTAFFLLISCNGLRQYERYSGISYIAPVGNPRAHSILWSTKDFDRFLVSASGVGIERPQVYILDNSKKAKMFLADRDYGVIQGESWSPDGRYVALTVGEEVEGDLKPGIWIVDTEDNSKEFFLEEYGDIAWSPDGKALALFSVDLKSEADVRQVALSLIDIESQSQEVIYTNENALSVLGLSWSFDRMNLVLSFSNKEDGVNGVYPSDIYVLNLETRKLTQLTHDGNSSFPQWSPAGNVIAYIKYNRQGSEFTHSIHLIQGDGTCDTKLPEIGDAISPTWSPKGENLAFIGLDGIYALSLREFFERDIYQSLCP
jgi:Tol biopolymer transport system component